MAFELWIHTKCMQFERLLIKMLRPQRTTLTTLFGMHFGDIDFTPPPLKVSCDPSKWKEIFQPIWVAKWKLFVYLSKFPGIFELIPFSIFVCTHAGCGSVGVRTSTNHRCKLFVNSISYSQIATGKNMLVVKNYGNLNECIRASLPICNTHFRW